MLALALAPQVGPAGFGVKADTEPSKEESGGLLRAEHHLWSLPVFGQSLLYVLLLLCPWSTSFPTSFSDHKELSARAKCSSLAALIYI